jgi:hypothetical protein
VGRLGLIYACISPEKKASKARGNANNRDRRLRRVYSISSKTLMGILHETTAKIISPHVDVQSWNIFELLIGRHTSITKSAVMAGTANKSSQICFSNPSDLISLALCKFSHASSNISFHGKLIWTHLPERGNLFLVFDRRTQKDSAGIVFKASLMKIIRGSDVIVSYGAILNVPVPFMTSARASLR